MDVTIRLIKSPLYECSTYTSKIQQGIDHINKLLDLIEKNIIDLKGKFKVIHKVTAIGAKEEEDIENMIKKLNEKQDDDTSSKNGEEDNEEGMNVDFDGYEDGECTSKTEGDEEDKKDDSDNDDF
jgi:hypothetical protein